MNISYDQKIPKEDDFFRLYKTTGWDNTGSYSSERLYNAIQNSWFVVCAYDEEKLVGFGRLISDGFYQTFLTDMIVHPDYQGQGIGSNLLQLLIDYCQEHGLTWVQLFCAKGKQEFYQKAGFEARAQDAPGMRLFLS